MANAKVILASGFNYQGTRRLKGEEIKGVSKLQLERWARLGYAEEASATAKVTTKAAPKKAAVKKVATKAVNTVTAAKTPEVKG